MGTGEDAVAAGSLTRAVELEALGVVDVGVAGAEGRTLPTLANSTKTAITVLE